MEAIDLVQCGTDPSHTDLDLRGKRCRECESGLKKKCVVCEQFVSYSNSAKHRKRCRGSDEEVKEKVVWRVAYVAAEWDVSKGRMPSGQYCGSLCENFPSHFQTLVVDDPTGDVVVLDAYDALWGTLFAGSNGSLELVHTFASLAELIQAMRGRTLPAMDVLVVGNWAHLTAMQDDANGKTLTLQLYHDLQELEVDQRIRVFPPLDYVWYFAQKVHYYNKFTMMRRNLGESIHPIPTLAVSTGHVWKKQLQEFAKEHSAAELMLKREFSEMSKHTLRMKVKALGSLDGRANGFRWMAQPFLKEFTEPEFRMFVVDGKCKWGVATRFVHDEDSVTLEKIACAPGRKAWDSDGGKEAAIVAEEVVNVCSKDMIHAARFLRVDMVKRSAADGGWWVNELEYFGNAFVHFEAFDNSMDMLQEIVESLRLWLKDLV